MSIIVCARQPGARGTVYDPRNIDTRIFYDALERTTQTVDAYDGGAQTTTNQTTEYTYDRSDHPLAVQADQAGGGKQASCRGGNFSAGRWQRDRRSVV